MRQTPPIADSVARMRVLVVNAGSSSLKLRVLGPDDELLGTSEDADAERALADLPEADAVGHRIVHGGDRHVAPERVTDELVASLRELTDLAPLHQPKSLDALAAVSAVRPGLPAVACFDTAFHAGMPAAAATYALPRTWRERWPVRRFGFHGLSHAYAARRAAQLLGRPLGDLRLVTCHLGAGASCTAVRGGRSVDTTMGFTPLEGLVMATRSGSVDPGLVLWLAERHGVAPQELAHDLEHASGLLGLAGTADMREVLERADRGDADARLALDVHDHRLRGEIARMAAAMDGLDAVVFTGGVGERSARVRAAACAGLGHLGVAIRDDAGEPRDAVIGDRAVVVRAREDLEIARGVRAVLR
jgi:acetate kinase